MSCSFLNYVFLTNILFTEFYAITIDLKSWATRHSKFNVFVSCI